jgi:hypothetical protein
MFAAPPFRVMAGPDPAIHAVPPRRSRAVARAKDEVSDKRVDGRVRPGHDGAQRGFAELPGVVYFAKSAP